MRRTTLFIVLIVTAIAIFFVKNYKKYNKNPLNKNDVNTNQEFLEEDITPVIIEKKEEKTYIDTNNIVNVPYYWKSGVNTDMESFVDGYIPNIKNFRKFYTSYTNLKFGKDISKNYPIDEIKNNIESDKILYSDGIYNSSEYFSWREDDCVSIFSDKMKSEIFICKNWVNWLGTDLEDKSYVLTECKIEDKVGYCIFEDYIRVYYDIQLSGQTRCLGNNISDYCDYNNYVNLIKYN